MRRCLAAALMVAATGGNAIACDGTLPDHVRILDCRLAGAVAGAASRSAMLNDLLDRVQRADGLVYVLPAPVATDVRKVLGGMSHDVSVAGRFRVIRIIVSGRLDDAAMANVGHELRHALEVLELSDARTEADVDALFDRIGWRKGGREVETQAALDTGYRIERELRAAKHKPHSSNE